MIQHYFKIACRNLLKHKVQNILSIVGLSIGFTAFLLGGYWHHWEYHFDSFHPQSSRTYALTTTGIFKTADGSVGELNQIHQMVEKDLVTFPEIAKVCHVSEVKYEFEKDTKSWIGMKIDSTFFDIFQCKLIEGSYYKVPFNVNHVILTQKMANFYFGDSSCVGKELKINDKLSYTIAGVMENYPQNSDFKFEYLILATPSPNQVKRNTTYVWLHPSADAAHLSKKIAAYRVKEPDTKWSKYSEWRFHLRPLPEIHTRCSPELKGRLQHIWILATAGILAFASALMNLLVLFIGQQQRKARYNATFSTLGASIYSLIGKNLLELTLPLFIAFLLSMAFIEFLFPFYKDYTSLVAESSSYYNGVIQSITRQEVLKASYWIYPLCCLIFLVLSTVPIVGLLKRNSRGTSLALRNGLIIGQIFIGSLFLLTSCMFYSQYRFMSRTDKGLVTDHIWQIDLGFDATYNTDCTPFIEALKQNSAIDDVTALTQPLLVLRGEWYCSFITQFPIEGRNNVDEATEDNCIVVQKNFLSFFGMKMKEGEWIQDQGTRDIVINETGARELNIPSLTGRLILSDDEDSENHAVPTRISGILRDFYYCPMQYPLSKVFFMYQNNADAARGYNGFRYFYIKVHPDNEKQALQYARRIYSQYSKKEISEDMQIIQLSTLMELFNRPEKTMFRIFLLLAVLCILISSFGVFFLVSLSTEQRKKEIAIRKVNGAQFSDILYLFLKEYLWLTLVSNAIALPLGYLFIKRWLETYAYHTDIHGWLFVCVFFFTCIIVILSVMRQVVVAAKINPAESVKSE